MNSVAKVIGNSLRSLGKATDAFGVALEGSLSYTERLNPSTRNVAHSGKSPVFSSDCFVAPNSCVVGDVSIGAKSSIWYNATVRGDVNFIQIGEKSSIQDGAVVHVAGIMGDYPTIIGDNVTIGPLSTVHACTIEDGCIIGTGAQILDGAVVKKNAMVAAGSIVTKGKVVGSGELWSGVPAKKLRNLSDEEIAFISQCSSDYYELSRLHAKECRKTFEEIEVEKKLFKGLNATGLYEDEKVIEKGGDGMIFKD